MGFLDSWDFMVFLQRDAGRGQNEPDRILIIVILGIFKCGPEHG